MAGLPRVAEGQHAGVSDTLNAAAEELDRLGTAVSVRRTGHLWMASSTYTWIPWQSLDVDTYGGGWDPHSPSYVYAAVDGLYVIRMQVRFQFVTSDGKVNTGPPYSAGIRSCGVLHNGSNLADNSVGWDRKPTAVNGEGVTLAVSATRPLRAGDWLLCCAFQTGGSSMEALQQDFSGTYLSLARVGRLP